MFSIFKFQYRTWIKSPSSLFSFIIPMLLLLVMAPMTASGAASLTVITGNIITINLISSGLMGFGFSLFEMKKSIIFKRIGSTQITKPMAISGFISWYFVVGLCSALFTLFMSWILSSDVSGYYTTAFLWDSVNWGGVIYGIVLGLLLSLSLGFFFASISKNVEIFNMITMLYFFFATFVGGLFFPISSSLPQYDWMTYVGYIIPHTYIAQLLSGSFSGGNVWDFTNGYNLNVLTSVEGWKAALDVFIPLATTIVVFAASTKTFKWDGR